MIIIGKSYEFQEIIADQDANIHQIEAKADLFNNISLEKISHYSVESIGKDGFIDLFLREPLKALSFGKPDAVDIQVLRFPEGIFYSIVEFD